MMRNKKTVFIGIFIAIVLLAVLVLSFLNNTEETEEAPRHSQLTGIEVEPDLADRPVVGIMIENSEEARPQSGLDAAGVVFEAVTEGGITRYLALYQEDMPEETGPVRSLRTHFLDWAMGFDASIAHVGGSSKALELADSREAKSLNQFNFSEPYYRTDDRAAPHNMYVKTNLLRELQKDEDHSRSNFADIPRSEDSPSQTPTANELTIDYSSAAYEVRFVYDQTTNTYTRYLAGEPHIDAATNNPITVKNVVVIKMANNWDNSEGSVGSGEAIVFKDGNATVARWQKEDFDSRIKIVDASMNEISLNRGDSWFAALPADRAVTY